MFCQTCKRESYALHGTNKKGSIPLCSVCGNRFDKVYFDIIKQLQFIADEDLTQAEKNIIDIIKDTGLLCHSA